VRDNQINYDRLMVYVVIVAVVLTLFGMHLCKWLIDLLHTI